MHGPVQHPPHMPGFEPGQRDAGRRVAGNGAAVDLGDHAEFEQSRGQVGDVDALARRRLDPVLGVADARAALEQVDRLGADRRKGHEHVSAGAADHDIGAVHAPGERVERDDRVGADRPGRGPGGHAPSPQAGQSGWRG